MNTSNYQIYFDCGFSKIRAGAFHKVNSNLNFYTKSKFFSDHVNLDTEIKQTITFLENNTKEYIDEVNLMIDSPRILSIGISVSKKIDGLELKQENIQFLIKEAKQQILKHYKNENIIHIIVNNYKVNNVDYDYLPKNIKCNFISLDILFICLSEETINYFKKIFNKIDISINKIICSSYARSINYKDNLYLNTDVSFVDVGFNKTSITTYINNKIISLNALPIGGNHITKDISKVLKIDLELAENIKLNFGKNLNFIDERNFSLELLQQIIFARTEEILEICEQAIKSNLLNTTQFKIALMGEGSKILDNKYKDKISFSSDIDFLEETSEDICDSGFKLGMGLNKQEVVVIAKKQINQGFFEKLFHLFQIK